jgi:hypothetical protein
MRDFRRCEEVCPDLQRHSGQTLDFSIASATFDAMPEMKVPISLSGQPSQSQSLIIVV